MNTIKTQGSLELYEDAKELHVRFADHFGVKGSQTLSEARRTHMIEGHRVNGSQAVTIKGWYVAWLQGAFDENLG